MAVIAFPYFAPQGDGITDVWKQRTISTRQRSPLVASSRTLERPGSEWVCTPRFNNLDGVKRAVAQQFLANCRGFGSRFYMPTFYRNRGSFPATEILSNNYFASGIGTWAGGSDISLSVIDGALHGKVLESGQTTTTRIMPHGSTLTTVTQYAPHVFRALVIPGVPGYSTARLRLTDSTGGGTAYVSGADTAVPAFMTLAHTPYVTSISPQILGITPTSGSSVYVPWASLARCALVDNGPNLLLQSDEFDTSWTATSASVDDQSAGTTDPIATSTADSIIEDGSSSYHFVSQAVTVASAADDYAFSIALKAGARSFAWIEMSDGTHTVICYFNLTTGAIGTPTSSGANFTNPRAVTRDLGNGWWHVTLVGRKASSSTTVTCRVGLATNISTGNYAGDGTSNIYAWRATLAQSSVPTRLSATTTTATTGTSQTGSGLYLKGLPASTNGLLLTGDWAEIITGTTSQAVRARAPLNSDAAGIGYFQFEAPLRTSPADGAAVIVCNPLIRASLDQKDVEWTEHDDGFSSLEFSAVEDLA